MNGERLVREIRWLSIAFGAAGSAAAWLVGGPAAALSLTISAAVVIVSFLVLEKVTAWLVVPRSGLRVRDVAVPAGEFLGLLLILAGIFQWKGFRVVAGLAGFSVVVAAILVETVRELWRR